MKLPKLDLPHYECVLPASGQTIKYRPYTVKEEKILLTAMASGNESDLYNASVALIENCCSVDAAGLHPTDLEFLTIRMRAVSVSPIINLIFHLSGCDKDICPETVNVQMNLDKIRTVDPLADNKDYIRKSDGTVVVPLGDDSGIAFKIKASEFEEDEKIFYDMFEYVYVGDEVFSKDEITVEDLKEWVDELTADVAAKIAFLLENQPKILYDLNVKCPKCGKEYSETVEGLLRFLD